MIFAPSAAASYQPTDGKYPAASDRKANAAGLFGVKLLDLEPGTYRATPYIGGESAATSIEFTVE